MVAPTPGATISQDGSTAIVLAGAGGDTNEMVRVATDLKQELQELSTSTVDVNPTGSSLLWSLIVFSATVKSAIPRKSKTIAPIPISIFSSSAFN